MVETKKTSLKATSKTVAKKDISKDAVKKTTQSTEKSVKIVAPSSEKIAKQVKKVSTYEPKLRIKLKSYDVRMLESSTSKISSMLTKSWASIKGPIFLPKRRKLYTVNTSHFVVKDSREQFEQFVYTRMIDVVETGPKTMETLQNLSIPVGVMVEVKVF